MMASGSRLDLSSRRGGSAAKRVRSSSLFVCMTVVISLALCLSLFVLHSIGNEDVTAGSSILAEAAAVPSDGADVTSVADAKDNLSHYDPLKCNDMHNGHCRDEEGGAWSYRKDDGTCTHTEARVPKDGGAVRALPNIFPDVKDGVLDFGGGVGAYMTSFRDAGVKNLVVIEPHDLGDCLFKGLKQQQIDLVNTPLSELPKLEYDLVMTIEVCEHLPHEYHPHIIEALTQASRKWLLFSAAHPGQPGEGHVGPSMKWRDEWVKEITDQTGGVWVLDQEKTDALHKASIFSLLKDNAFIMRKQGAVLGGGDAEKKGELRRRLVNI